MMHPPVPMMDDNPFKDDNRPMDPNSPAPGQSTYKQYYKKNNTVTARNTMPMPTPAKLDPYAAAPVRIKAQPAAAAPAPQRPVAPPVKIASREPATMKVSIVPEIETVSLMVADDVPPAPPATLSTVSTSSATPIRIQRYDASIPANPLR